MMRIHCILLVIVSLGVTALRAHAVTIEPDEIAEFSAPCMLFVSENGATRTLSWSGVTGASTYKVGYRLPNGTIVTLAEVTNTSYEHIGWAWGDCLEYLLVACDGSGLKVCAAHVPDVGSGCPQF